MSATTAGVTNWELRLKEYISAPFKKLIDYASTSQKKLAEVASGMDKAARASIATGREFKRSYSDLENTLKKLEERQKSAFSTKHIQGYQQLINRTKAEMQQLSALMTTPTASVSRWQSLKNSIAGVAGGVPELSQGMSMLSNPMLLATGGAIALGVALKKSGDLAFDYNTGMAKVNATAQLSDATLAKLKNRLVEIGSDSGGYFELVPQAYERILSQTSKVNLSLDVLETSLKGAKAGFTDIDTVAGAVAQTLSAVGEKNTTANEVLDTYLKAKAVGAGEFSDFAQYLPQLIASAKNLSISYKDTAGLFAYMTAKGQSATDSAMLLQNAFTALQKNEVMKGLAKKGISLFDAKGNRRDIQQVFLELTQKLDGLSDKKKTKFLIDTGLTDAQARNAFSVLTSDADKFRDIMTEVNNSLGEADRQLAKTQNYARSWGSIGDEIKSWGVAIGDYLLPVVDSLVRLISDAAHGWKILFNGDLFKNQNAYARAQADINMNAANDFANRISTLKYGKEVTYSGLRAGSSEAKFWTENYKKALQELNRSNSKNFIDKSESEAEKALKNANKGGFSASKADVKEGVSSSIIGDESKVRSLTMHLTVNNYLKADTQEGEQKIKRVLTDVVVSAARDAMVTIGV